VPKKCGSCPKVSLTATGGSPNCARMSSQSETRQAIRVGRFDSVTVVWVASVKVRDCVVDPVPLLVLDGADGLPQATIVSIITKRRGRMRKRCRFKEILLVLLRKTKKLHRSIAAVICLKI
jgi:hypothetical protein